MQTFTKILIPIDFSAQSAEAVRRAISLNGSSNAEVVLVHCYDPTEYPLPSGAIAFTRDQIDRLGEPLLQRLRAVQREAESLGARNVTCRLEYGEPAAGIVRMAAEEGFDLIVMGTHGRTGARRWVMGSVAEKVVRAAPCPVLSVKAPAPPRVASPSPMASPGR